MRTIVSIQIDGHNLCFTCLLLPVWSTVLNLVCVCSERKVSTHALQAVATLLSRCRHYHSETSHLVDPKSLAGDPDHCFEPTTSRTFQLLSSLSYEDSSSGGCVSVAPVLGRWLGRSPSGPSFSPSIPTRPGFISMGGSPSGTPARNATSSAISS